MNEALLWKWRGVLMHLRSEVGVDIPDGMKPQKNLHIDHLHQMCVAQTID